MSNIPPPLPTCPAPIEIPYSWASTQEEFQISELNFQKFQEGSMLVLKRTTKNIQTILQEHTNALNKIFKMTMTENKNFSMPTPTEIFSKVENHLNEQTQSIIHQIERILHQHRKKQEPIIKIQAHIRGYLTRKRNKNEMKLFKGRAKSKLEIITSERKYFKNLDNIVNIYMKTLNGTISPSQQVICNENTMQLLFSNIELILNLSSEVLKKMESQLFDLKTSKFELSSIFVDIAPFFKLYIQYVNNYDMAIGKSYFTFLKKSKK